MRGIAATTNFGADRAFMRGIEAMTNFRADRAAESGLLQIPKAENQRDNFQDILTLNNIINDHLSTSFHPLKLNAHESQWAALAEPGWLHLRLYWSIHPHFVFAMSTRQDSETLK